MKHTRLVKTCGKVFWVLFVTRTSQIKVVFTKMISLSIRVDGVPTAWCSDKMLARYRLLKFLKFLKLSIFFIF